MVQAGHRLPPSCLTGSLTEPSTRGASRRTSHYVGRNFGSAQESDNHPVLRGFLRFVAWSIWAVSGCQECPAANDWRVFRKDSSSLIRLSGIGRLAQITFRQVPGENRPARDAISKKLGARTRTVALVERTPC